MVEKLNGETVEKFNKFTNVHDILFMTGRNLKNSSTFPLFNYSTHKRF